MHLDLKATARIQASVNLLHKFEPTNTAYPIAKYMYTSSSAREDTYNVPVNLAQLLDTLL